MGEALYSLAVSLEEEIETPKPETETHKGRIPGTQRNLRRETLLKLK